MGIIMIIICVNKCVYLFSILIISRRGLRSPSEIISSLSNTLSQYVSSLFDVRRSVLHGGPKIMILKRCLWCYCLLFSKVVERVHSGHSNECGPAPRVRQPMDRFVTLRLNLCGLFGHHLGGGVNLECLNLLLTRIYLNDVHGRTGPPGSVGLARRAGWSAVEVGRHVKY